MANDSTKDARGAGDDTDDARQATSMSEIWVESQTGTHQDHVVAHVVGASVLGYFVKADALHLLLDIGFIWIVYLDAEMGLVPESLAISELETDANFRARVAADADALRHEGVETDLLSVMRTAPAGCLIEEITIYESGARRRLTVRGEASSLIIETSIDAGEIKVEAC